MCWIISWVRFPCLSRLEEESSWLFSGIYGPCHSGDRGEFWDELAGLDWWGKEKQHGWEGFCFMRKLKGHKEKVKE